MASEQAATNFLSSNPCTFGQPSPSTKPSSPSSSNNSDSIQSFNTQTPSTASSNPENPFGLLMNMAESKCEPSGDVNLIYDFDLDKGVVQKEKKPFTSLSDTKSPRPNQSHPTSPPSTSSTNNPISTLFAERAARFSNSEAATRQAELDAKKAAQAEEQARLKARRERVERLAREKLEDDKMKRGKEWDRKVYEEKVRAEAVLEVERKKREDMRERERIKRYIRDDEERRREARRRVEMKYGRKLG